MVFIVVEDSHKSHGSSCSCCCRQILIVGPGAAGRSGVVAGGHGYRRFLVLCCCSRVYCFLDGVCSPIVGHVGCLANVWSVLGSLPGVMDIAGFKCHVAGHVFMVFLMGYARQSLGMWGVWRLFSVFRVVAGGHGHRGFLVLCCCSVSLGDFWSNIVGGQLYWLWSVSFQKDCIPLSTRMF